LIDINLAKFNSELMQFRAHLPLDCPPSDATSPDMEVYILVSDPIDKQDFLSQDEKKPGKFSSNPILYCQSGGLSVFTDAEGAKLAQNVSRGLRHKKLAVGQLCEHSGIIKNTPSQTTGNTHHTWWVNSNINPCTLFKII
jgi:hypothetical protein